MSKKTTKNNSFLKKCLRFFRTCLQAVKDIAFFIRKGCKENQFILERIQLTFIYFFALMSLTSSVQEALGFVPEILFTLFPFFVPLTQISAFRFFASPEKMPLVYMFMYEICLNRKIFGFSLLVRYNILSILSIELLQNLSLAYWELFFTREVPSLYAGAALIDKSALTIFNTMLFLGIFALYAYAYLTSLRGLFPVFPGILRNITDSVAFWLQIKIKKK